MISSSAINIYRQCPLKYKFKYIERLPILDAAPWMKHGSEIHRKISNHDFESKNLMDRIMLRNAKTFLTTMPPNPIMETTYEDKNNPGRFYGVLMGRAAVGIFDYHWRDVPIAGDWKTGKFYTRFNEHLEIQAFILDELYYQHYGNHLREFYFNFIKANTIYVPRCISITKVHDDIEYYITNALDQIDAGYFPMKNSTLCNYCEYKTECERRADETKYAIRRAPWPEEE